MKLTNFHRVKDALQERDRLRTSLGCALGDDDIKVQIQGREAQGPVRQACLVAIAALYETDLQENTKKLTELGVEVNDLPVEPSRRTRDRREV